MNETTGAQRAADRLSKKLQAEAERLSNAPPPKFKRQTLRFLERQENARRESLARKAAQKARPKPKGKNKPNDGVPASPSGARPFNRMSTFRRNVLHSRPKRN